MLAQRNKRAPWGLGLTPKRTFVSPKVLDELTADTPFGISELKALEGKFARMGHRDVHVCPLCFAFYCLQIVCISVQ